MTVIEKLDKREFSWQALNTYCRVVRGRVGQIEKAKISQLISPQSAQGHVTGLPAFSDTGYSDYSDTFLPQTESSYTKKRRIQ